MAIVPEVVIKIKVEMEEFKRSLEEARFAMRGLHWTLEAIRFKQWRENGKDRGLGA